MDAEFRELGEARAARERILEARVAREREDAARAREDAARASERDAREREEVARYAREREEVSRVIQRDAREREIQETRNQRGNPWGRAGLGYGQGNHRPMGGLSPYAGPPGPSGLSAAEVARMEQLRRGISPNRPVSPAPSQRSERG